MIPPKLRASLYIVTFLFFLSCQKKDNDLNNSKNNEAEVEKLITIANTFFQNKKLDSSFYYYNKAKFICNPITDSDHYVSTLNRMATIQQSRGDFAGSESTITEALPYLKYVKNNLHVWNTYTTLGTNYLNIYDYKNAILYHQKALQLNTSNWKKLNAKNNIAVVLTHEERYNEALEIFLPLATEKEVIKNSSLYGSLLDNIGLCYTKLNETQMAFQYLNKGLEVRQKSNDIKGLGKTYANFAEFYEKSNPYLAKKYMLLSYKSFNSVKDLEARLTLLKLMIRNSSNQELKKYSTTYVQLVDSLFEIRQKAKNEFAKIKYDSKKEKDENLKLRTHKVQNELQLEKQKNKNIISYIIIILSLSLLLTLYFYLISKGNKEKIEATYKSETRIAKKLHDELANDIYHTMAFAENKNLSITENKEQLLNSLDAIYSRTRDISKENNPIVSNENYILYLKEMLSGFNTFDISIILNGLDSINWNDIERNKKITIYRVLQELLVNMKKHSNATLVEITFKKSEKNIEINYTDNGKGADINEMTLKNGLHNVETRILSIKGRIDIDSAPDKGFKVFIKFPLT
ncbi:tetratricopeptide repeat-containing sensor histidine kinase [Flavobacterium branchiicola]|uniref:histidine kinase n=1 Tax=Flavobacterium branchiicola TaxID=1114875 RepID=A0ABV9PGQ3_9FLAO|nr:ATP-binding protein [Flavobacterium branchiicola]MBS7255746.1 tetratricopeptide repeat protein [Flavobacterium branchiicola]